MTSRAGAEAVFVIPYLGDWPLWMPHFLRSCAANPGAVFHLMGNRPLPRPLPANLRADIVTAEEIENRARSRLGVSFSISDPHKLCDLRPFYSALFSEIVAPYEFWGYCDLDVVFGDLSRVLKGSFLDEVDVFSAWDARKLVGHFTLLRNSQRVAAVAYEIKDWRRRLAEVPGTTFMDEGGLTEALRTHPEIRWRPTRDVAREYASGHAAVGATLLHDGRVFEFDGRAPVACVWDGQRTFVRDPARGDIEVLYIHFMGLKRPYQWLRYDPAATHSGCTFSLLGFRGGMIEPAELRSWSHRTRVLGLRCLALLVALVGRVLPIHLKARVMRPLRRE